MSTINKTIMETMVQNNNMITTSMVEELGFSRQLLQKYVHQGLLERVQQGLYILPDMILDDMYTLMLRSQSIVFSHESALFLYGLSDRTPFKHSITFPSNRLVPRSIKNECVCFYIKPELHTLGITEKPTTFGNLVRCYNTERTICDLLRTRDRCDEETVISALKQYASFPEKDLNRLASYADIFRLTKEIKKYLEVLL